MRFGSRLSGAAIVAAVALAGLASQTASADSFEFSYEFSDGFVMSGTADGIASGNLVTGLTNINVFFNGVAATNNPLYGSSLDGTDSWQSGGATLSFDGTANNFLFIDTDYPTSTAYTQYWYDISPWYGRDVWSWDGVNHTSHHSGTIGTWSLTSTGAVPEPGTLALLGMGLLGAAARRRRRRAKVSSIVPSPSGPPR